MGTQQMDLQPIASELPVKQDAFLEIISNAVKDGAQADVVGKMLDHYERFQKMQAKKDFDEAMQNFKKSVPEVVKNRIADMGKFKVPYADIEGICDTIEPFLMANGLDKRWTTEPRDKEIVMVCVIKHISGHSESTILPPAPPEDSGAKNDVQSIGASLTYLQRYSLLMALGIAPRNVDTDGNHNKVQRADRDELKERIENFPKCLNLQELEDHWRHSYKWAKEAKDQSAMDAIMTAKNARKAQLLGVK